MKKFLIISILMLIICLVSYFIGKSSIESPDETILDNEVVITNDKYAELQELSHKLQKLSHELQLISQKELEEYLLLKTQSEKYQKADELLGKIFQLFLANLSLEINKKQKDWVEESVQQPIIIQSENVEVVTAPLVERDVVVSEQTHDDFAEENEPRAQPAKLKKEQFEKFADKFGRKQVPWIDSDVWKEQWQEKRPLRRNELQVAYDYHVRSYPGRYKGTLRLGDDEIKVYMTLSNVKKTKSKDVKLLFKLESNERIISLRQQFMAYHSKTHSSRGGPCRALILHDNKTFQVHLIRLKSNRNILVKIYKYMKNGTSKKAKVTYKFLGNLYLVPVVKSGDRVNYRGRY